MNEVSLKPVIEELESLFSKFNTRFFAGELEKPVITVSPDHTRGAYGWCTGWKAWQDGAKEGGYYEINLCAEYLNRPFEETCSTLIHEMVHLKKPSGWGSGHFPFRFVPQPKVQERGGSNRGLDRGKGQ